MDVAREQEDVGVARGREAERIDTGIDLLALLQSALKCTGRKFTILRSFDYIPRRYLGLVTYQRDVE